MSSPRGPLEKAFASQLEAAMQAKRLSPSQLSVPTNITASAIRAYLRGTYLPRPPAQVQLEKALQVRFNLADPTVTKPEQMTGSPDRPATPLTIAEAKAGLALTFNIDPSRIDIDIHG